VSEEVVSNGVGKNFLDAMSCLLLQQSKSILQYILDFLIHPIRWFEAPNKKYLIYNNALYVHLSSITKQWSIPQNHFVFWFQDERVLHHFIHTTLAHPLGLVIDEIDPFYSCCWDQISKLKSIKYLYLYSITYNQFSSFSYLQSFGCYHTLPSVFQQLQYPPHASSLYLSCSLVSDETIQIPSYIKQLVLQWSRQAILPLEIEEVRFEHCKIHDLRSLTKLKRLCLYQCSYDRFSALPPNLVYLELWEWHAHYALTDIQKICHSLMGLKSLKILKLNVPTYTNFSFSDDLKLDQLYVHKSLKKVIRPRTQLFFFENQNNQPAFFSTSPFDLLGYKDAVL